MIGIGTRYSDFTTASRTAFGAPGVRFVNINVASFDAAKHGALMVQADARAALVALTDALAGWSVDPAYREEATRRAHEWDDVVGHAYALGHGPLPAQSEVIGAVNEAAGPRDVVVCAAGSLARRSAQVVADARPQGLPCRVRLFVHGLRDRGRHGRQDGGSGPQRVHHGRRRLLPDARPGAGHRRPGADPADRRAHPEPRLPVDRGPIRISRRPAIRDALPLSRRVRSTPGRNTSGRSGRQCGKPRRAGDPRRRNRRTPRGIGRSEGGHRIRGPWSSTWRPTRSWPLRKVAAGGTCRSRSRSDLDSVQAAMAGYQEGKRRQRAYL